MAQKVYYPQKNPIIESPIFSVFLAGTVDSGKAKNWQKDIIKKINKITSKDMEYYKNLIILNPRRDDIKHDSWKISLENEAFVEQVRWEQSFLEWSSMIVFNFEPESISAVSLMEFGMYSASGKVFVHCSEQFPRKGYVDYVCAERGIPQTGKLEGLVDFILDKYNFHMKCLEGDMIDAVI